MGQNALKTLSRAVLKEAALILTIALLSIGGAILFYAIEGGVEASTKNEVRNLKGDLVKKLVEKSGLGRARANEFKKEANKVFQEFEEELLEAYTSGSLSTDTSETVWSLTGSLFYVGTVFTTVGYGNIYPTTTLGKLLTILYAAVTIPLVLIFLDALGKIFTRCLKAFPECARVFYYSDVGVVLRTAPGVKSLEEKFQWPNERPDCVGKPLLELIDGALARADESFDLPLVPALLVLTAYTASGALMYSLWEDLNFIDAFYFVFITISTIGFGDVLPAYPSLMILTSLYVFVGLGVCSMVINVIVEVLQRQMPTTIIALSTLEENVNHSEESVTTNIEEDFAKTVMSDELLVESVEDSNIPFVEAEPSQSSCSDDIGKMEAVPDIVSSASLNEPVIWKEKVKACFRQALDCVDLRALYAIQWNQILPNRFKVNSVIREPVYQSPSSSMTDTISDKEVELPPPAAYEDEQLVTFPVEKPVKEPVSTIVEGLLNKVALVAEEAHEVASTKLEEAKEDIEVPTVTQEIGQALCPTLNDITYDSLQMEEESCSAVEPPATIEDTVTKLTDTVDEECSTIEESEQVLTFISAGEIKDTVPVTVEIADDVDTVLNQNDTAADETGQISTVTPVVETTLAELEVPVTESTLLKESGNEVRECSTIEESEQVLTFTSAGDMKETVPVAVEIADTMSNQNDTAADESIQISTETPGVKTTLAELEVPVNESTLLKESGSEVKECSPIEKSEQVLTFTSAGEMKETVPVAAEIADDADTMSNQNDTAADETADETAETPVVETTLAELEVPVNESTLLKERDSEVRDTSVKAAGETVENEVKESLSEPQLIESAKVVEPAGPVAVEESSNEVGDAFAEIAGKTVEAKEEESLSESQLIELAELVVPAEPAAVEESCNEEGDAFAEMACETVEAKLEKSLSESQLVDSIKLAEPAETAAVEVCCKEGSQSIESAEPADDTSAKSVEGSLEQSLSEPLLVESMDEAEPAAAASESVVEDIADTAQTVLQAEVAELVEEAIFDAAPADLPIGKAEMMEEAVVDAAPPEHHTDIADLVEEAVPAVTEETETIVQLKEDAAIESPIESSADSDSAVNLIADDDSIESPLLESMDQNYVVVTSPSVSETSLVDVEASKMMVDNLVGESDAMMLRDIDEYSISSEIEKECSNIGADVDFGLCLERENTLVFGEGEEEEEEMKLLDIPESSSTGNLFDDSEVFKSMVDFDTALEQEPVFGREWTPSPTTPSLLMEEGSRLRRFSGGSYDVETEPESRASRADIRDEDPAPVPAPGEITPGEITPERATPDETLSEAASILSDINSILADLDAGPTGGTTGFDSQMMEDALLEEEAGSEDFCGRTLFQSPKRFS